LRSTLRRALLTAAVLAPPAAWAAALENPQPARFDPSVLDWNKDPCTDFYAFACSRWLDANPIPGEEIAWGTSSPLNLWSKGLLRQTLEDASRPDSKRTPTERLIGDAWAACMDEPRIEKAGLAPLKPDLDRIARLKDKRGLAKEIALLHLALPGAAEMGNNGTDAALFGFGSTPDFDDASTIVLAVDQGGMALPGRDDYLGDDARTKEIQQKYLHHVEQVFTLAGQKPAAAKASAATVLRMETALARASMDNVTRRDPKALNNVRSLAQLEESTPSFDWKAYLAAVGAPTPKHYLVSTPGFMTAMDELIRTSSLEDWKTYLRWWTLHGHAPLLSSAFVQENFDFFARTLSGSKKLLPRWRRCVNIADRDLGEALGAAYVERAFPPESKRRVDQLVSDLRASLATGIDGLDWMAPATKKAAQEKLGAILQKIGYPGTWRDYGTVKIDRASLVQNVRSATAFELRRQLAKVGKPPDRLEWTMTPPTVNAYYSSQFNTINFPAGMLQPPYFDATKDDAVNYGAIGMVIGHEILHGFDDSGRQFDATGTLRDWWTPADAKAYEQRSSCIVNQYTHDVPDLGVKTNGKLTQGEDIADNGGIRLALAGLDRALAKAGQSATSKGPDGLTARQRFFAGNAFAWCQNPLPGAGHWLRDAHLDSLHEYRVNYVLANQPEFREAFGCSAGKPMSPAKACRVW